MREMDGEREMQRQIETNRDRRERGTERECEVRKTERERETKRGRVV